MTIGERVKKARESQGISGACLASKIGVSQPFISEIERDAKTPSIQTLQAIAKGLKTTVSSLLGEPETPISREAAAEMFAWFAANSDDVPINMIGMCIDYPDLTPPHWDVEAAIKKHGRPKRHIRVSQPPANMIQIAVIGKTGEEDPPQTIQISRAMLGKIDPAHPPWAQTCETADMYQYGVPAGALVVVNPAENVETGDVALVELGDKTAVKAILKMPGCIELHSDKGAMTVTDEHIKTGWFKIHGKIVRVLSAPRHGI